MAVRISSPISSNAAVRDFLARHLTYRSRNHRYSPSQMILALVYPIVLGLDRLETTSFLRFNGTFQYLTGLPGFPDPQTLRRFLHQAPDSFLEQMHRVNDRLLQNFIHRPDHRSRTSKAAIQVVLATERLTRPRNRPVLRLRESPLLHDLAKDIQRKVHRLKPIQR